MPLRLAIVGPGRVGQAFGRRFHESGVDLLGYVGRTRASAEHACAFAGAGQPLEFRDLPRAHVVVFAVGDPQLPAAVETAVAAVAQRPCSLWIHTSARYSLEALLPLAGKGVRIGVLHPVMPFASAASAVAEMAGKPATLISDPRARHLLLVLCRRLSLVPVWAHPGGERALYHAACVLAANGLTALRRAVDEVFLASNSLSSTDAAAVADALMRAALDSCARRGPVAALSGPVVRGDADTLRVHRRALSVSAPELDRLYCELMRAALPMARERGLLDADAIAVQRALAEPKALAEGAP